MIRVEAVKHFFGLMKTAPDITGEDGRNENSFDALRYVVKLLQRRVAQKKALVIQSCFEFL
jgi:hypothetical protein